MSKRRYFITGGGTGGHIYPAVAVAEELLKNTYTEQIFYVGNPNNLEANIVGGKNYIFLPVISSGMPRKIGFALVKWLFNMFFAWLKCCKYIRKYKPDVIFGTGGYVSAPVLLAGITMNVPFVMHDCDANPGLVTRKLSPFAKSVSIAFESAKNKINNGNCFVNGNPIRDAFLQITKGDAIRELNLQDKMTLCVMGGSQGAKRINESVVNILKDFSQVLDLQVIFQTGKRNFEDIISKLEYIYPEYKEDKNIIIKPYFDNMPAVLNASDIAISRAGSLSISELCACGVASIFVPYPYAAADHQRKNAKFMVEKGAGLYLEDEDTTSKTLYKLVESLIKDKEQLLAIKKSSSELAKYDGAKKIAQLVIDCKD